jgi:hypothetical protein
MSNEHDSYCHSFAFNLPVIFKNFFCYFHGYLLTEKILHLISPLVSFNGIVDPPSDLVGDEARGHAAYYKDRCPGSIIEVKMLIDKIA